MQLWLDDERPPPPGWTCVRWREEAIALLERGGVEVASLDHDLGNDEQGTGYDVLLWVEEAVATRGFEPPEIRVHTANPAARRRMEAAVAAIERLANRSAGA